MVQVRPFSCICAVHADSTGCQLAGPFRLVSSHGVRCSLHYLFRLVCDLCRRRYHRSGTPIRSRHLPTPLVRLHGLLACYLDIARSFQRCARFHYSWGVHHRIRRVRQPSGGPNDPHRLSAPLPHLNALLGL